MKSKIIKLYIIVIGMFVLFVIHRLLTLTNLTPIKETKLTQQNETLKVRLSLIFGGMFVCMFAYHLSVGL